MKVFANLSGFNIKTEMIKSAFQASIVCGVLLVLLRLVFFVHSS